MARPYSLDLRNLAVRRVNSGESVRSIASDLEIATSSVVKWSQRERRTGSPAAGQMGGHRPKKLVGEPSVWLRRRMKAAPFTLRGLVRELETACGLKVDYRTVWSFVHAEKLSFKKKRVSQRATTP
jgi:transposase